jgi:hypothetical protein
LAGSTLRSARYNSFAIKTVDAGVDLFDEALFFSGVSVFDDLLKRIVLIANDASVAVGFSRRTLRIVHAAPALL